jgi:hypothetical protein
VKSLYLSADSWDLAVDSAGNIATCTEPYRLAQDAATAIRTFTGDCYYDQSLGLPYWTDLLGRFPSLELLKSLMVDAALTVPGVVEAKVFLTSADRVVSGQVQVSDRAGALSAANF